jgi:uncharacterized protein (TIGR02594 family)
MDQPAWLAAAWAEFGVREIPGKDDAPEILRYFREAGDTNAEADATPWCAAFLGSMLKRGGQAGTGSLLARSYLAWGDALDTPRLGAVAVLSRGDDPNAGMWVSCSAKPPTSSICSAAIREMPSLSQVSIRHGF